MKMQTALRKARELGEAFGFVIEYERDLDCYIVTIPELYQHHNRDDPLHSDHMAINGFDALDMALEYAWDNVCWKAGISRQQADETFKVCSYDAILSAVLGRDDVTVRKLVDMAIDEHGEVMRLSIHDYTWSNIYFARHNRKLRELIKKARP